MFPNQRCPGTAERVKNNKNETEKREPIEGKIVRFRKSAIKATRSTAILKKKKQRQKKKQQKTVSTHSLNLRFDSHPKLFHLYLLRHIIINE